MTTPTHSTPRYVNAAHTAIEQAQRGRRVLVVVRSSFEAVTVMDAIERALPLTFGLSGSNSNGRWYLTAEGWQHGRVEVAVIGRSLHGRTADTLMPSAGVTDQQLARYVGPLLCASDSATIAAW